MAEPFQIDQHIQLGQLYVREGRLEEAHQSFLKALERLKNKPPEEIPLDLISYFGLTLSLVEGDYKQGLRLCRNAVSDPDPKPEYYLNLGKVYLAFDQKAKGIRALYNGLRLQPRHTGIIVELKRLGKRRRPLLGIFSRNHFLNRYLGTFLRKARTNSR